jgi:putative ABC transport system permease protein
MTRFVNDTYEGLVIASNAVKANPLRSTLTMLGIIIGIVTVTLMGAFLIGINDMFKSTVSFMGTDVYYVDKFDWASKKWMNMRNRPDVSQDEADQLRARMTTAGAISINVDQWLIQSKYKAKSVDNSTAVGIDEPYKSTGSVNVEHGRFMSTAELLAARPVCVIGAELADKLFPNEDPLGKTMRVSGYPLEVIGVAKKVGGLFGVFTTDNQVLMPIRTFFSAFGDPHRSVTIAVKAKTVDTKLDTRNELEATMRQIRKLKPAEDNNFGINSQDQFNKQIDALTITLDIVGFLITGLSLLVGGIGIMNVMLITVRERTREIGVRKAIGAKRRSILVQFLAEASMLSLIAGLVAIVISFTLSTVIDHYFLTSGTIHLGFPVQIAMLGIALSIGVGLVSGFIPAWKASKLDPVEALRYE